MSKQQLMERLQKLWIQAGCGCGGAPAQLLEEIREVEAQLDALEAASAAPDNEVKA